MKTTGAACVSEAIEEEEEEEEDGQIVQFRRFSHRARTRLFGYFKHVKS